MSKLLEQINIAERKTYHIKDMGRVVTGKTPSKNNPEDWGDEVDFITPTDFSGTEKYLSNIKRKISKEGISRYKNMILPSEAVVVTCIGSDMGKVIVSKNKSLTNQQINSIIVNKELFDTEFVYYTLKSLYTTLRSIAEEGGSTMPIITKSIFEQIEFEAPDLPTQREIASILGAYDEKIENNNKIIKNLEETAQTIFNEWFVNFKFPGYEKAKMVDSEMGEIPEGWEVGKIKNLIKIESGFAFKSDSFNKNGKYKLVTIRNVQDGEFISDSENKILDLPKKLPEYCKLKTSDILLSLTGNVGRVCIVIGDNYVLNQRVSSLIPVEEINRAFTYFLFRGKEFQNLLISLAKGSAQPNLSPIDTKNIETLIPNKNALSLFNEKVNQFFIKIIKLKEENISLKSQRDLLLNKLI